MSAPRWVVTGAAAVRAWASGLSTTGLWIALLFFCASLTPSLIPRVWLYQALVTGVSVAVGYAVGRACVGLVRLLGFRTTPSETARRRWLLALGIVAIVAVPTMMILGARWQDRIRDLMGAEPGPAWNAPTQAVVAVVIAVALLQLARGLRWCVRRVARFVGRWVPAPTARLVGFVFVAVLAVLVVDGTVVRGALSALNSIYANVDDGTREGVVAPTNPLRSGSPESAQSWDTLGLQGRTFVAGGFGDDEIADVAARRGIPADDVRSPVRAYAGMSSGATLDDVAANVVAELDRTDAWSRSVLAVVTTTGTGWVDPSFADTFELMHSGDTAIAAMQYSYLPSWVSFIGDRSTPPAAGRALFEAVYDAWSARPADDRPRLVTFGLSLGSYGGQGAFSGLQDMATRTQGALWVGTPGFTDLWNDLAKHRDDGSSQIQPVLDRGHTVRWSATPGDASNLFDLPGEWTDPRIVYLQHPSDGVTWWNPDLVLGKPDWLREPRGTAVLPEMEWIPFVTFFQVTGDLMVAADVPPGYGHSYHLEYVDALAAVTAPEQWTDADRGVLREVMAQQPVES
ncbi:alpha/beta-hydrolase family protein [Flavimobilis sp. GY10621]|uniref:Alpha/beta-hydrolase family protein n=1 Tax=Flavimobilis rhizosphaerae TaxID=2775421 RepID=A0ABR9DQJ4_9MICO|nr:alpha/beta-hydrolase family protein [Flavimobilis rhizosphaerae]MBD9699219.1 alpha/beta-hydrolase family protein [Flavimobilis rhizosphaerae]